LDRKKIREFAALCRTSAKTLRFYDRAGIMKADYVDPENGYRYYHQSQVDQYNRIVALKNVGFTLEEIRQGFLDAGDEDILRRLNEKETALLAALENCRELKMIYEERGKRKERNAVMIHAEPGKDKLILDDGTRWVTLPCRAEDMEVCCELFREIFGNQAASLRLADIDLPVDMERPMLLLREMQAETEEEFLAETHRLFAGNEELRDVRTAVLVFDVCPEAELEVVEKVSHAFSLRIDPTATLLWGANISAQPGKYRVRVLGIF